MPILDHDQYWSFNGKYYRFDVFKLDSNGDGNVFPSDKHFVQVYGLVLNPAHDSIILVYHKENGWILPGGQIELNESFKNTLIREVEEETNRIIDESTIVPAFYQDVYVKKQGKWIYKYSQARCFGVIKQDRDFVKDPDNDILEVQWVKFSDLGRFLDWGKTTDFIKQLLRNFVAKK